MSKIFTAAELFKYNASDPTLPVYVAIKGAGKHKLLTIVYDVSASREMYTAPKGYSVFSGKDASKALGKSSLKAEECVPDYSELTVEELDTLDKWVIFFAKKYPVIGHME